MNWVIFFLSTYHQQSEVGTRKPDTKQPGDRWPDNGGQFNEVRENDEDYDDYDRETPDRANMDWDSIGDFSQYPKAAGSDVSCWRSVFFFQN